MGSNSKQRREAKKRKLAAQGRQRQAAEDAQARGRSEPFRVRPEPRRDEPRTRPQEADDTTVVLGSIALAIDAIRRSDEPALRNAIDTLMRIPRRNGEHLGTIMVESRVGAGLRTLWANGWQPLDVAHIVGRELSQLHRDAAIDAIGAEHRSSKYNRVDPRWQAQLISMGTIPPEGNATTRTPSPDVHAIESDAAVAGALRTALEIFTLLVRLPKLVELMPPPSKHAWSQSNASQHNRTQQNGSANPLGTTGSRLDEKILARVRALLAKAESTTFDEEADALTSKAQELMARHAIDLAMLDASSPNHDAPTAWRIHFDDPYVDAKSTLLGVIARENRCNSVFMVGMGFSTLFGFAADLDIVELLYTSLLTQATSAMLAAGKSVDRSGRSRTRSFRQSFLVSFAYRIGERLREATAAAKTDAQATLGDSFLPVLASRTEKVDEFWRQIFPETTSRTTTTSNAAGWAAGRHAADNATLNTAIPIRQRA